MVAPRSTNPNDTSGRFAKSQNSLVYPSVEGADLSMQLKFMKYSRFLPNSEPYLETTAMISLPMPQPVQDRASMKVNNPVDLGTYGNIDARTVVNTFQQSSGTINALEQLIKKGISGINNTIKGNDLNSMDGLRALVVMPKATDALMPWEVSKKVERFIGTISNPHTTTFFEGINLRPYTLTWNFSPRSAQESDILHRIIRKIKERIHPAEALNGFALDYPDLVQVEYIGNVSKHMPKYYQSFVSEFNTSFGNGANMAFFADGAPVQVEMTMSFIELSVITRDTLQREDEAND